MSFPTTILFDLDGTLVDTAPDLCAALNHTLGHMGAPAVDEAHVRHMVGQGARRLIEQGLAAAAIEASEQKLDEALALFLDYYGAHIADHSQPFEGTRETLAGLIDEGARLGICTNKPQGLSEALMEALEMRDMFAAIVGADVVKHRKPHPAHILETLELMEATADGAVMVGDSVNDVEAARNAGIPVVVVSFGYTSVPADELGADALIAAMQDLPGALRSLG